MRDINIKTIIIILISILYFSCTKPSPTLENDINHTTAPTPLVDSSKIEPKIIEKKDTLPFDKDKYQWKEGYILTNWQMLSKVIFEDKIINDTLAMVPIFHDDIKVLHNQPVQISGYLIPFRDKETGKLIYSLSAYPNSQCFYCGGGGPETIMDLLSPHGFKNLKMDQFVTYRGILKLNATDLNYLNYILTEAELVKK